MTNEPVKLNKYKIRLLADSKKTQGLQAGDIVRRQYFVDPNGLGGVGGASQISTTMAVLETGVDMEINAETSQLEQRPYFIGAVLLGDDLIADQENPAYSSQLLDFARITNLFNLDRSGALYLTASDSESPYMDVVDGIGRNASLCWPENLEASSFSDPKSQYIVIGEDKFALSYSKRDLAYAENGRVLTAERLYEAGEDFEGLKQDFYDPLPVGESLIISFKARSTQQLDAAFSLGYSTGTDFDAEWNEAIGYDWKYYVRVVRITKSGRHLRTLKMSFGELYEGEQIQVADLNILPLSAIANFNEASAIRVGRLEGVVDPVFGQLSGYGAYMQKLYATKSAHVSGTLTAGDENGFGATFYAGKIHRNCFIGSTDINCLSSVTVDSVQTADPNNPGELATTVNFQMANPVGIGHIYRTGSDLTMKAQSREWLATHVGEKYCLSFWLYAKHKGQFGIWQNDIYRIGTIQADSSETHVWRRMSVPFEIVEPEAMGDLTFKISPSFDLGSDFTAVGDDPDPDENVYFICAPQLEKGDEATQYQPTDGTLRYTDAYGAWLAEGGIGGTIQNPLIQLNKDGSGSIESRGSGFRLNTDGSGHLAKRNIRWDSDGKVTFGRDVTLNWDNFSDDAQEQMTNRSLRIMGADTFTGIAQGDLSDGFSYSPASITLTAVEKGFSATSSQRQWYYETPLGYSPIANANGPTLTVDPDWAIWGSEDQLVIQCVATLGPGRTYSDVFTVRKQILQGYTVAITSSRGTSFQNGECQTFLKANVYYQGQLVDEEYAREHFQFSWKRWNIEAPGTPIEIEDLETPDNPDSLLLDYELDGTEVYSCEISTDDSFDYSFPVTF